MKSQSSPASDQKQIRPITLIFVCVKHKHTGMKHAFQSQALPCYTQGNANTLRGNCDLYISVTIYKFNTSRGQIANLTGSVSLG